MAWDYLTWMSNWMEVIGSMGFSNQWVVLTYLKWCILGLYSIYKPYTNSLGHPSRHLSTNSRLMIGVSNHRNEEHSFLGSMRPFLVSVIEVF